MFDKYILRGNERDIVRLVDDLWRAPDGEQNIADLQGAVIEHFIAKASRGNDGAFSPAGLNNAIESFGTNRMKAIFTPYQIARINDIKQVSDILLQQPLGSPVNHSNTASAAIVNGLVGITKGVVNIGGKFPVAGNLIQGAGNIAMKKVGDVNASGAASKALSGKANVTKGSSLGLTEEQLKMLGMIPTRSGQAGSALGANIGY